MSVEVIKSGVGYDMVVTVKGARMTFNIPATGRIASAVLDEHLDEQRGVSTHLDKGGILMVQSMVDDLDELHAWGRMSEPVPQTTLARLLIKISNIADKYRTDDMVGD